ncbi:P-loop NTPase fold protein [Pectobacterium carotovorum subsp. carotovorum]|uniref:P-loop NTPase fold protein n=1 Tax=Pectobacterium carotovorum TaxID=554 RepID=UPI0023669F45|nr:P-loop NTPase fold protein [Pectobacterium carotovorum]WDF99458.1 P-loop NTPase fold protein [Pectobacterium carotovorum subsp. carotovorum]
MDGNKHIANNIYYYLNNKRPGYAFLITGPWGSGKTFFIKWFINNFESNFNEIKSKKFINISLFGLDNTSHIREAIFCELYPFLGSKFLRFIFWLVKSVLKINLKIDLNNDKKDDVEVNLQLNGLNGRKFISSRKIKNIDVVIILDDLERTNIPIKEVLGYIYYLVDVLRIKVIIIADEERLVSESIYRDFKEKIIGKTFYIRHDVDCVLNFILSENKSDFLSEHSNVIIDVYRNSECDNLRILNGTILDFNLFIKQINGKYLENTDFSSSLIKLYFSFSFEIKKLCLLKEEFIREVDNSDGVYKKYNLGIITLYDVKTWANIIFDLIVDGLDSKTSDLSFFHQDEISKEDNEEVIPAWKRLISYSELEYDEFKHLVQDVENSFQSNHKKSITLFMREFDLLLHFSLENLIDKSVVEIESIVSDYFNSDIDGDEFIQWDGYSDGSGYGYYERSNDTFYKAVKIINDKKSEIVSAQETLKKESVVNFIYDCIKNEKNEELHDFLFNEHKFNPIFNLLDEDVFVNLILDSKNKWISKFSYLIKDRYSARYSLNNHSVSHYMGDEVLFWRTVEVMFKERIENMTEDRLKKIILERKILKTINEIIIFIEKNRS